jgi:hypothetical protein
MIASRHEIPWAKVHYYEIITPPSCRDGSNDVEINGIAGAIISRKNRRRNGKRVSVATIADEHEVRITNSADPTEYLITAGYLSDGQDAKQNQANDNAGKVYMVGHIQESIDEQLVKGPTTPTAQRRFRFGNSPKSLWFVVQRPSEALSIRR